MRQPVIAESLVYLCKHQCAGESERRYLNLDSEHTPGISGIVLRLCFSGLIGCVWFSYHKLRTRFMKSYLPLHSKWHLLPVPSKKKYAFCFQCPHNLIENRIFYNYGTESTCTVFVFLITENWFLKLEVRVKGWKGCGLVPRCTVFEEWMTSQYEHSDVGTLGHIQLSWNENSPQIIKID